MKHQKIPMEWMGAAAWRLPSGKALAEFALQSGFLAPLLLGDGPFARKTAKPAVSDAAEDRLTKASR